MLRTGSGVRQSSAIVLALATSAVMLGARAQNSVAQLPPPLDVAVTRSAVVGDEQAHVVEVGDTLPKLAAWYGIDAKVLAAENGLKPGAALSPAQSLTVPNRHIVPSGTDGIVVNVPQRHLFHISGGVLQGHYPIAVGRGDWRTPTGGFWIAKKETDPSWEVPKSIQEEMRRSGKPVRTHVSPGPNNPLGKYWLGLNRTGVGIHGTNSPSSIYKSETHGCIRLHAEDIEQLFPKVSEGTPVNVIYQPVLLAIAEDGVYLEAHPDVYRKGGDPFPTVQRLATEAGAQQQIDWEAVRHVLARREGIARRVSR